MRYSSWNERKPATITLLVIGIFFVGMAVYAGASAAILAARGVATTATVLDHQRMRSGTWTDVRFVLPDGHTVTAALEQSLDSYTLGETIPVRYDPENPGLVADERALHDMAMPAVAGGMAALCLLGAALTWFRVINWVAIARRWG